MLVAAVLHATWNALVKSSGDRFLTSAGVAAASAVVSLPVLLVGGLPSRDVWAIAAASSLVHVAYLVLLTAAYERTDLSVAYPIARGTAPALVAVVGIAALDDDVRLVGLVGIGAVTAGLVVLARSRHWHQTRWALATGVTIAGYTAFDGWGVRRGDESLRYISLVFVLHASMLVALVLWRRGLAATRAAVADQRGTLLLGGAASAGAYLLVMTAARTEPLGLVAGLRETSAVVGTLIGWRLLGERVTRRHAIAVAIIAAGAVAISQG